MSHQMPAPVASTPEPARKPTFWLRLTSYGWDLPAETLEEREVIRRSQLAAWVIFTLLVVDALLLLAGISDPTTLLAVIVGGIGFLFAAYLNRRGHIAAAGGFLIVLLWLAITGAIATQPGGLLLDLLPSYDFYLLPVLVAVSILPRRSAFVVAAINCTLICLDFFLQPHAPDLQRDLATFPSDLVGAITLLIRPIALQVLVATIAFLWVRGLERAVARANSAERVAALEHAVAEQRIQLEEGVSAIEQTLNKVANGQYPTRVPRLPQEQLWRVGSAINTLLNRLQRAADTEQDHRRIVQEIQRLAASIEAARKGKPPMWPQPSGTPVDLILQQIPNAARPHSFPPLG